MPGQLPLKPIAILVAIVSFLAGAIPGYWLSKWHSEEYYTQDRIERLHRISANEVKTYIKLLHFTRNDDRNGSIKYLEALLDTAHTTLYEAHRDFPDAYRSSSISQQALKDMDQYRSEYPQGVINKRRP